jgi:hypothetical protein
MVVDSNDGSDSSDGSDDDSSDGSIPLSFSTESTDTLLH